jgi:hypothetical protein
VEPQLRCRQQQLRLAQAVHPNGGVSVGHGNRGTVRGGATESVGYVILIGSSERNLRSVDFLRIYSEYRNGEHGFLARVFQPEEEHGALLQFLK